MPPFENPGIFRQLADVLPFGLKVVDPEGRIVYWNRRAEHITGYLSQEVLGRTCRDALLVHCGSRGGSLCDTDSCPLACVLTNAEAASAELFLRHKQGHRVPARIHSIPLCDDFGRILGIAELFQDVNANSEDLCWTAANNANAHIDIGPSSVLATQQELQSKLAHPSSRTAVFLIELEHLREMAQSRGSEMVNAALRALLHTIPRLLTVPHYLGCWTQNRFLLLVPGSSDEAFHELLDRLEGVGGACSVMWWGDCVTPHVRVRGTFLEQQDSVDTLMRRLEPDSSISDRTAGD